MIGHRGSPCLIPEETLESFTRAAQDGADLIEWDVISSQDGVLLAHHDLTLDATTDVQQLFPGRESTHTVQDKPLHGFFAKDFNWKEIQTLRVKQAMPFRNHALDGMFEIPSLSQVLELANKVRTEGKEIGVYIESKDPEFHRQHGLALEEKIISHLKKSGFDGPIILQSFSRDSLYLMKAEAEKQGVKLDGLIWLVDCTLDLDELTQALPEFKAKGGTGIGPDKSMILAVESTPECGPKPESGACYQTNGFCSGRLVQPTSLVQACHDLGLVVHPWTLRNEMSFLPLDFASDPHAELQALHDAGVDGVFTDCPRTTASWRSCALEQSCEPVMELD